MRKLLLVMLLTVASLAPVHAAGDFVEDFKSGLQSFKEDYSYACSKHYELATEDLANVVANYMGHYINPSEFRLLVGALRARHITLEVTCVFAAKSRTYLKQKDTYIDFHRDVVRAYQDGRGDIYYGTLLAKYGFRSLLNLF